MTQPTEVDPRLIDVIHDAIGSYLKTTPVMKLSQQLMTITVADAVWEWLAEGDPLNLPAERADRSGDG